eukprot:EG_transcript_8416
MALWRPSQPNPHLPPAAIPHPPAWPPTIGDSFMCVAKGPAPALRFALAVQEEFARYDWGTDRIDRAYGEMGPCLSQSPGCWNGLRIRIGIHFGHGNIKLDPVSRGYDYYGTVVNTAARIESVCHGGQIAVSEAVFAVVEGQFPGAVFTDLGPQPLRGLVDPLRLVQVLPEGALSKRRFPPLRIDRKDEKEDVLQAETDLPPSATLGSSRAWRALRHSVAPSLVGSELPVAKWIETHALVVRGDISVLELHRHYQVLQVGFSTLLTPLAHAVRQHLVRELCAHLHVPNHGAEGPHLQHTLHGLIGRALPATAVHRPDRRRSAGSVGTATLPTLSPKAALCSPRLVMPKSWESSLADRHTIDKRTDVYEV